MRQRSAGVWAAATALCALCALCGVQAATPPRRAQHGTGVAPMRSTALLQRAAAAAAAAAGREEEDVMMLAVAQPHEVARALRKEEEEGPRSATVLFVMEEEEEDDGRAVRAVQGDALSVRQVWPLVLHSTEAPTLEEVLRASADAAGAPVVAVDGAAQGSAAAVATALQGVRGDQQALVVVRDADADLLKEVADAVHDFAEQCEGATVLVHHPPVLEQDDTYGEDVMFVQDTLDGEGALLSRRRMQVASHARDNSLVKRKLVYYEQTSYVYMTPTLLSGLLVGMFLSLVALTGLCCMDEIMTPTQFAKEAPPKGKEF